MTDGVRFGPLAPQFLVDDLERAIDFYRDVLGFSFGPVFGGFYAVGAREGAAIHLKHAPKTAEDRAHRRREEHLDAYADVTGIEAVYRRSVEAGAPILKPLAPTGWGTRDFYVTDPDGYIIGIGERALPD